MKSKIYLNNSLLVLLFCFFAGSVFAQKSKKVEFYCEDIRFTYGSGATFNKGNLIISDNAYFGISSSIIHVRNSNLKPSNVSIILIGKDIKGTKWVEEVKGKLNEKTGLYDAAFSIKASNDNPFLISEVSCSITDNNNETSTQTESFTSTDKRPSFTILLNGYENYKRGKCEYGKCFCLSGNDGSKGKLLDLGNLSVEQTIEKDTKKGDYLFSYTIGLVNGNEEDIEMLNALLMWNELQMFADVTIIDENGKTEKRRSQAVFHRGQRSGYDARHSYIVSNKPVRITNISLQFMSEGKEVANLKAEYQSGYVKDKTSWTETWLIDQKTKDEDPCKTKYKLKDIDYTESTVSGLYGLQFSFQFEDKSDVPYAVRMIVQLTDCKGNKQNIEITLKYNDKTRTYSGGQTISQSKECPWELTYGEIAAYNECKDKTVWSFDPSKAKGNGSGTKNASSQVSARPQLL